MIEAEFISKFDDADAVDMSDTTTNITEENIKELHILAAVSYTHLTLPTKA